MQIAANTVVTMDYTLTDPAGKVLDTSKGADPLTYLHGVSGIIPGLENALTGKSPGDSLNVTIEPEQAYGARNENLIRNIPRSAFSAIPDLKPGTELQARGPEGQTQVVSVVAVGDEVVTIDANHPLAGVRLIFDVKVIDVRAASEEEITHRHVHGPGGHQH